VKVFDKILSNNLKIDKQMKVPGKFKEVFLFFLLQAIVQISHVQQQETKRKAASNCVLLTVHCLLVTGIVQNLEVSDTTGDATR
jgi:hypothetical protein